MVRPDGVKNAGPAVTRITEAVQEDEAGRLLDPRPQHHRLHRHVAVQKTQAHGQLHYCFVFFKLFFESNNLNQTFVIDNSKSFIFL